MSNKLITSLRKCITSFTFAKKGLTHVVLNENNFNYHIIATFIVLVIAYILNLNNYEWIILILIIGMVYIAEVFNTAIEKLVDLLSPQYNPKAGLIKDIAAGGVLVASIFAVITGLILFLGKIF
ncbi:MAG: diacylglycerol kinase family protein [Bacteroidota bacterium]|nr:diacylglycerol kinase family protein [Bacteroidota bacterium]